MLQCIWQKYFRRTRAKFLSRTHEQNAEQLEKTMDQVLRFAKPGFAFERLLPKLSDHIRERTFIQKPATYCKPLQRIFGRGKVGAGEVWKKLCSGFLFAEDRKQLWVTKVLLLFRMYGERKKWFGVFIHRIFGDTSHVDETNNKGEPRAGHWHPLTLVWYLLGLCSVCIQCKTLCSRTRTNYYIVCKTAKIKFQFCITCISFSSSTSNKPHCMHNFEILSSLFCIQSR